MRHHVAVKRDTDLVARRTTMWQRAGNARRKLAAFYCLLCVPLTYMSRFAELILDDAFNFKKSCQSEGL